MDEFRFIDLELHTAYENMAIDEAIMLSLKEGNVKPTLRLYRWSPSAVSIGTFQGMNDVIADGKKVSGNAQTRRHACVLQHGTILLDLDVNIMFQALKVPKEKISDKMITDVKQRVTSIRDIARREITMEELNSALQHGFSKELEIRLVKGHLTGEEEKTAEKLAAKKYSTFEWNFKR
jgi:lipoate-protein ligase A